MEFENQYLTYQEYQELGGTLEEAPFNILEFQAQKIVDKYTTGKLMKLETQTNDVKLCILHLILIIDGYSKAESNKKGISSESTDGYSVSYSSDIEGIIKGKKVELKNVVLTDLAECKLDNGIPYLYVGADVYDNKQQYHILP